MSQDEKHLFCVKVFVTSVSSAKAVSKRVNHHSDTWLIVWILVLNLRQKFYFFDTLGQILTKLTCYLNTHRNEEFCLKLKKDMKWGREKGWHAAWVNVAHALRGELRWHPKYLTDSILYWYIWLAQFKYLDSIPSTTYNMTNYQVQEQISSILF